MTTKNKPIRKIISILLIMALLLSYLPIMSAFAETPGADTEHYNRVVDANTMDNWVNYFDINEWGTANAGGVWTDKSVFIDADAFGGKISMIDENRNFLTALSAIAANKEIIGYSTVPTDTVFVLDLSNSMSSDDVQDLVDSTNAAISKLQSTNNNNRVGVVLYSGSSSSRTYANAVAALMPIDRYTTTATDNNGNEVFIEYESNEVALADNRSGQLQVSGTKGRIVTEAKEHGGATYIQAGLFEAWKLFDAVPDDDIRIGDNNWQSGDYRMPIVVLMSDGAPTLVTSFYHDVENSTYGTGNQNAGKADAGNGNDTNITEGQGFLVQLTASFVKNKIENKYKVKEDGGAGRSLFYTLGFNINTNNTAGKIAYSVLNPDASTITDSLWETYNDNNSMQVRTKGRDNYSNNSFINVNVSKNSYATSKSYVDEYFSASGTGLNDAFDNIVEEILLQSRYYPTHLEGGSPDFSGYVEFTDELGEYMEVKQINGILLGNTLFDGHMMASKIADTSADGLGTVENPTALGDEFIRAVKTRLGIVDTVDAQLLVAKAFEDGQLAYNGPNDWSNYIAWYAKADGTFAGFYDKDGTEPVPADAVYINRSYGFLGETHGSIKNSDMMYMSVQIHENIETGSQTVIWKIPAALVPMITYKVTLKGNNVDSATDVNITVEEATPVRLIYETGLRADLNEFNITRISGENIANATVKNDERHIAADGYTRLFWNNKFNITGEDHDTHKVALSEFTPNKENERFYYTFDSAVFKNDGNGYVIVPQGEQLNPNGEYYHRRYNFVKYPAGTAANDKVPVFEYEKMSKASIEAAVWKDDFELLDNTRSGAYVVPKGTPARELNMFDEKKLSNNTSSADMVFHPYLSEYNNTMYVDMNLGNNGMLSVTPATGIKISKTVDIFETGTLDTFKFRVTINGEGSYDYWITALDETPSSAASTATFTNGVFEFELKKDQTFWISGLPSGTAYSVEEISDNSDYKIKSVHVNGIAQGKVATGTVAQYLIDDVDFVNTAVGEGDLVITKQVVDAQGNIVDVNDDITFTAEVTLRDSEGNPVTGTFQTSNGSLSIGANGKFTVALNDGESFVVRGIPEETEYTVVETNIPNGFTLNAAGSVLEGVVEASAPDRALIVNTYIPTSVDGDDITVNVTKTISGGRTSWQAGESYTFILERLSGGRTEIGRMTISNTDTAKTKSISLNTEAYTEAGIYYYAVTEEKGTQGGITYDTGIREFSVTVADTDMDGDLEITAVTNVANTVVSGNWNVSANFNNVYAAAGSDTITLRIQKAINGNQSLAGYRFALYDENPFGSSEYTELLRSPLTNAAGETQLNLVFPASMAGETYTYYLAEVPGANPNITYTDKVYKVEVTVTDNLDGTVSAEAKVYDGATEITAPEIPFTNIYTPSTSDYVTFSGTKVITTNNRVLNANEFTFKLEAVGNAPLPANTTAKNSINGSFQFAPIEFTAAGEYKYVITEDDTNRIRGFKYDDARYEITVTVTDANAALTAEITRFVKVKNESTTPVTDIVFENEYYTIAATLKLEGTKLLTGKKMRGGEFGFEIEALTTGAPTVPSNTVVTNHEDGNFDFATITFDKAGTFVYRITEVDNGDLGYTYDNAVYIVTVTVTDNSEGLLTATYAITRDGMAASEIVFRNTFTPEAYTYDIDTEIGIGKTLDGRPLADGEFEFALINAINGQQIGATVKNDASGNIDFPELTLREAGTYHYKVVEVIGDEIGINYDNTVYHVVLTIAQIDDEYSGLDGQFEIVREELYKATIVIDESTGVPVESTVYEDITGETIEFVNSYTAIPAEFGLGGTKTLVGRELEEGEFTFNLYFAKFENGEWVKDQLIEQVKNDAEGNFSFENRISEGSAIYIYFITEDVTNPIENVTYDTTEYMVTVTSTDNLDGTISVEYTYTVAGDVAEGVAFVNTYTEPVPKPEPPKTGDTTNLALWFALLFVSSTGFAGTIYLDKKKKA